MKQDYKRICKGVEEAERKAAELVLQAHGILAEAKSGKRDVVTEYDRRVQTFLIEQLQKLLPDAGFFCEEMKEQDRLDGRHVFIIDPIDGTMNLSTAFTTAASPRPMRKRERFGSAPSITPISMRCSRRSAEKGHF